MPLLFENDFNGQTSGTDVTVANSGVSGSSLSHVLPTTGTIKYLTELGRTCVEMTPGSGTPSVRWTLASSEGRVCVTRRSFNYTGILTQNRTITAHHTNPIGSPNVGWVQQRANFEQLELVLGTTSTPIGASRLSMEGKSPGRYWIELYTKSASAPGANDGAMGMRVYEDDGVTRITNDPAVPDVFESLNLTDVHPGSVRWGTASGSGGLTSDKMYDPRALFTDTFTTWLGPIGSTVQLDTPSLSLIGSVPASSISATDGEKVVSWPPVTNADHYDAYTASHGSTDYTLVASGVTSPYTFEGLPAGNIRLAIKAKA